MSALHYRAASRIYRKLLPKIEWFLRLQIQFCCYSMVLHCAESNGTKFATDFKSGQRRNWWCVAGWRNNGRRIFRRLTQSAVFSCKINRFTEDGKARFNTMKPFRQKSESETASRKKRWATVIPIPNLVLNFITTNNSLQKTPSYCRSFGQNSSFATLCQYFTSSR